MATQKSRRFGFLAVFVAVKMKEIVRFRDIHSSPDSDWRVDARRLYAAVSTESVQYSTLHVYLIRTGPAKWKQNSIAQQYLKYERCT
jgi:hypothetical protein